jgi:hypothetical protein
MICLNSGITTCWPGVAAPLMRVSPEYSYELINHMENAAHCAGTDVIPEPAANSNRAAF